MRRAIFSTAIILITCFVFQGTAFSAAAEVRGSADVRNSGEIVGNVNFCGPQGTNGAMVDLVGRSFSAVLGTSGDFNLQYVPEGAYTLRASIPDQPDATQPVTVFKGQITNIEPIMICPDNDGDGFLLDEDCNDNNPNIFPGAEEFCDGVDNDCDGIVDAVGCDCTDADNDGFFAQDGCGTAVDCDDSNNTINTNATDICDGVDNNCDGGTDEGFDLLTDSANCGACANACSGVCTGGECFSVCGNGLVEGSEQCDDGNNIDGDGCQADCTLPFSGCTSNADCPLCESCEAGGVCQAILVGTDPNNECAPPFTCDGAGMCTTAVCGNGIVEAGEQCDDGNPQVDCSTFSDCNGACVDLLSDSNNCGLCGESCGTGEVCNGTGVCEIDPSLCQPGQTQCGPVCFDLATDENNCGACGNVCSSGGTCVSGTCTAAVCGNGIVEAGEACDGGACCNSDCTLLSSLILCRSKASLCDEAEFCDGANADCPADFSAPVGTECGNGNTCDGSGSCRTTCVIDSECSFSAYCDGIRCSDKRSSGASCFRDGECESGSCITFLNICF